MDRKSIKFLSYLKYIQSLGCHYLTKSDMWSLSSLRKSYKTLTNTNSIFDFDVQMTLTGSFS